jgi:hypothetical protein
MLPCSRCVIRPSLCNFVRPFSEGTARPSKQRARGMPGVRCTRGLCKKCTVVATGSPGSRRHSLRNGFTVSFALSPVTGLCCHRRLDARKTPGSIANLTPASGRQDHTTSPYARPRRSSACAAHVHRSPHPTSVTIAKRPSFRARDGARCVADLRSRSIPMSATQWHDGQITESVSSANCRTDASSSFLAGEGGSHLCESDEGSAPTEVCHRPFNSSWYAMANFGLMPRPDIS